MNGAAQSAKEVRLSVSLFVAHIYLQIKDLTYHDCKCFMSWIIKCTVTVKVCVCASVCILFPSGSKPLRRAGHSQRKDAHRATTHESDTHAFLPSFVSSPEIHFNFLCRASLFSSLVTSGEPQSKSAALRLIWPCADSLLPCSSSEQR